MTEFERVKFAISAKKNCSDEYYYNQGELSKETIHKIGRTVSDIKTEAVFL